MQIREMTIKLVESDPVISRKLHVPMDMTLHSLHFLIQDVMPWANRHLHVFKHGNEEWTEFVDIIRQDAMDPSLINSTLGWSITQFLKYIKVKKFTYLYDFGDNWEHEISIGKLVEPEFDEETEIYPKLIKAKGNVPIEDSGGITAHNETAKIMRNPKHKDYDHLHKWYSEFFHYKYTPHADIFPDLEYAVYKFARRWNTEFSRDPDTY